MYVFTSYHIHQKSNIQIWCWVLSVVCVHDSLPLLQWLFKSAWCTCCRNLFTSAFFHGWPSDRWVVVVKPSTVKVGQIATSSSTSMGLKGWVNVRRAYGTVKLWHYLLYWTHSLSDGKNGAQIKLPYFFSPKHINLKDFLRTAWPSDRKNQKIKCKCLKVVVPDFRLWSAKLST